MLLTDDHSDNIPHLVPPDDDYQAPHKPADNIQLTPGPTAPYQLPRQTTPAVIPPDTQPISQNTRFRSSRRPVQQQAYAVIDSIIGKSCEYKHLITGTVNGHSKADWEHSFANELGRLANGVGTRMPTGTNTIAFIHKDNIPTGRIPTYGRIVVSVRPQKTEKFRTRLTVGGNLINYPFEVSMPTADLTTAKILFNSVVSTPGAKFMVTDIKDFYLNTEMERYKYMRLPAPIIPVKIMTQYNLHKLICNGFINIEI